MSWTLLQPAAYSLNHLVSLFIVSGGSKRVQQYVAHSLVVIMHHMQCAHYSLPCFPCLQFTSDEQYPMLRAALQFLPLLVCFLISLPFAFVALPFFLLSSCTSRGFT